MLEAIVQFFSTLSRIGELFNFIIFVKFFVSRDFRIDFFFLRSFVLLYFSVKFSTILKFAYFCLEHCLRNIFYFIRIFITEKL